MSFVRFPIRFGKYIILDRVSAGGMAEVYRAKTTGLRNIERLVAIKRMLPTVMRDPHFVPMFIDEAKLAARLTHPNIAQTYELGASDDGLFIAMELVLGRDLNYVMKVTSERHVELPLPFVAYVGSKTAEALEFAHRAAGYDGKPLNLVHRDVSPQNILIAFDGQVKIVDFGIAKADLRTTKTMPGVLKGKLSYMAPEQALEGDIDHRTDIFGLGIVLWEMLAGRRLFDGDNALVILERICHLPIPDVRSKAPRVPEALAATVHRCLERDPAARFQSADAVVDALAPFLIEERNIFGDKQSAELMRALLPLELEEMQAKLLQYRRVSEADCVQELELAQATSLLERGAFGDAFTHEATPREERRALSPGEGGTVTETVDDDVFGAAAREVTVARREPSSPRARPTELGSTSPQHVEPGRSDTNPEGSMPQAPASARRRPPRAALVAALAIALVAGGLLVAELRASLSGSAPPPAQTEPPSVTAPANPPSAEEPRPADAPLGGAPERDDAAPLDAPAREAAPTPEDDAAKASSAALYGYLSVRADTIKPAVIFVDGKELGYSPILSYRLRVGAHQLKIVVMENDRPVSTTLRDIKIGAEHKRNKPLRMVVVPGS